MKHTTIALLSALSMSLAARTLDDGVPHKIEMNPPVIAYAGDSVTFHVELDAITANDQAVDIGSSSSYWYSIPSQVTVPAGYQDAYFGATTRTTATGNSTVTATCNGVTKTVLATVSGGG